MEIMFKRKTFNSVSPVVSIIINIIFIICCLACVIPVVMVFSVSFSDENTVLSQGYKLIPTIFSVQAYKFMLNDIGQIIRSYGITMIVTAIGTVLSLILTLMYAYALFRKDFPFRRAFTVFIFITMLFNGGLVPFYILYTQYLGLKNSIFALILPYLLNPFFVVVMRTFLTGSIPDSLVESAKLDGAREHTVLLRIILPLALPAIATIGLFTAIVYWNDWYMCMLFVSKPENINIQYYLMKTMQNVQFMLQNPDVAFKVGRTAMPTETLRMAMAVVGIGPIVLVFPFFQKYYVKGLTIGAVKG